MALNDNLIISIDWLQLYCSGVEFNRCSRYEWREMPYQTKQFRKLYEVIFMSEEFAQVQLNPVSSIIPADTVIVKFKNRQLYGTDIIYVANCFLNDCGLLYKSITRLDLAVDFNKFAFGLFPSTFIQKFLSSDFLKIGQGKYTLIGAQSFSHTYEYIRFGTKTSAVNVYLYNKSKELEQVQDKPYIRKKWSLQGLNLDIDVWRLEISIKSDGKQYVNLESGEIEDIQLNKINDSSYLSQLFFSYIHQYFRFVKNDGQKNKTRMQLVKLFECQVAEFKPMYLPKEHGSNRTDKIFVKKLYQLDCELRDLEEIEKLAIRRCLDTVTKRNNLSKYVSDHCELWSRSAFKPN